MIIELINNHFVFRYFADHLGVLPLPILYFERFHIACSYGEKRSCFLAMVCMLQWVVFCESNYCYPKKRVSPDSAGEGILLRNWLFDVLEKKI
jgi:hypothetical protein